MGSLLFLRLLVLWLAPNYPKRKRMASQAFMGGTLREYFGHQGERRGHEFFLLVVREEVSGTGPDQVSSPASLRVKWQQEKKGLQLVCGEVSRVRSENVGVRERWSPEGRQ
jgi:hypothetical protein